MSRLGAMLGKRGRESLFLIEKRWASSRAVEDAIDNTTGGISQAARHAVSLTECAECVDQRLPTPFLNREKS